VVFARARRLDVVEQVGRWIAPHDDVGASLVDELLDVAVPPGRRALERVLGRVQETRSLHVLIPVEDADVAGAGAIRLVGDRPRERRMLDVEREHDHILVRRHVRTDANRELREPLDPVHCAIIQQRGSLNTPLTNGGLT
jgi:hypothetical protein